MKSQSNLLLLLLITLTIIGGVISQKTNTLKILQPWETPANSPLQSLLQPQYPAANSILTNAAQVCVRGLQAFYSTATFTGTIIGPIRSVGTGETCVDGTPYRAALSSRTLGNYDFSKPSVTIWSVASFVGLPIFNVSNVASTRPPIILPGTGAGPPLGSIVTTGIGYRYFFSTLSDFASASYVTCIDTVDLTSDNRFFHPDLQNAAIPPATGVGATIRAVSWAKSATTPPPGMSTTEAGKLVCYKALDQFGRRAPQSDS